MKTILFKTIIIAFFVGTAVSCSDEDENRFRPGSTHEKPNPTEPEGGLDYSKLTADNHPRLLMNAEAFTALKAKVDANASANLTLLHNTIMGVCNSKGMNATALTYKLDASNKRILDVSRDALLRIFTCAYAYRMVVENIVEKCKTYCSMGHMPASRRWPWYLMHQKNNVLLMQEASPRTGPRCCCR